jgi:hypothetical protein
VLVGSLGTGCRYQTAHRPADHVVSSGR